MKKYELVSIGLKVVSNQVRAKRMSWFYVCELNKVLSLTSSLRWIPEIEVEAGDYLRSEHYQETMSCRS